jgi:hypothetical protein
MVGRKFVFRLLTIFVACKAARALFGLEADLNHVLSGSPEAAAQLLACSLQSLEASVSAGDDGVRIGAPDKGPCLGPVVLGDKMSA